MAALAKLVDEHVSKDDPKTLFSFHELQEGTTVYWEVECLKETGKPDEYDVHWLLRFKDKNKAQAEFDRWINS